MIATFVVATVFITLAELGDKTQLLALCLAARYRTWQVLAGIAVATLLVHLLSTVVGQAVGGLIPELFLKILTGVLFIGFGLWTLRGDTVDEESCETSRFGPVLATGVAFFFAELGDKTQIMTMSIAADPGAAFRSLSWMGGLASPAVKGPEAFWGVWMGSTLGMLIADGLAIGVGAILGKRLPERLVTRISGVVFLVFGAYTLVTAFLG